MLDTADRLMASVMTTLQPYQSLILTAVTVIGMWLLYILTRRALRRYVRDRSYKLENVQNFLLFYRYIFMAIAAIIVITSMSGSIGALGISAAFLGMVLGWSLQAPVTGIAAWLMVILKRPFKLGDRVIIAGITGDVMDINLTHIVLNQVGGTVGGEERSGRGVLIPNATLFGQIIYNYAIESRFLLDEVTVLITFESDFDRATEILLQSARKVTADIIAETGAEPFTRNEIADSGVRVRVRYQAIGNDRQRISSEIVTEIIRAFNTEPSVSFCYPHLSIYHAPTEEAAAPKARK